MLSNLTFEARLETLAPFDGNPTAYPTLGSELHKTKNLIKCVYDFAVYGGAVGTFPLLDDLGRPAILPAKSIITRSFAHAVAAVTTSASGTLGLTAEAASDTVAQLAAAALGLNALAEGVQTGAASLFVITTVARQLTAKIATGALTAGKVNFFVEYVITN